MDLDLLDCLGKNLYYGIAKFHRTDYFFEVILEREKPNFIAG